MSRTNSSHPRSRRRSRFNTPAAPFEVLERRELLSAAIVNAIPAVIPAASGTQSAFAPGVTRQTVTPSGAGTFSQFYSFALDGAGFSEQAKFELKPAANSNGNSGVALYDENGNLVAKADTDANGGNLTADLQTRRRYILGVFVGVPVGIPFNYNVTATTGAQLPNATVKIDPSTGVAAPTGANPEDAFASPTDVDYYPIDLSNGGAVGSAVVTPTGLDVKVSATLFRRADASQPWEAIDAKSGANGGAVTLNVTPPANGSLSDGQYMLAVAPLGLDTAAGSYRVDATASPVLGPASVNSLTATDLSTLPPVAPGVAGVTRTGSINSGQDAVYKFRAPAGGPVTITLHSDAFHPMLSVYNGSGLVDVASRTVAGDATLTYNAPAGEQVVVRVGDVGNNNGGAYNFGIAAQYGTTNVALQSPFTNVGPVQVGPDQTASFFRVQTNNASDVLLVEATPNGAGVGARIVVVGQNMAPVEINGAAGQKVLLPANIAGLTGPFDIYVAGSAGAGSVSLRVGQFDVPNTIDASALTAVKANLQGDFNTGSIAAGAYGAMSGVKYHQLPMPAGQPAPTVTVQGNNGSQPLAAVYGEENGVFKLVGFATPSSAGVATMPGSTVGDRATAVAAFSLNFDGGGTNVFNVNGPDAVPVPIGMVPDLAQLKSNLSIREVKLGAEFEQAFWETRLPTNMLGNPEVKFKPKTPAAGLAAKVTIYRDNNGSLTQLGTFQTTPGADGSFTLAPFGSLQNAKTAFLVEPLAGDLGDGIYTLEMSVATSDPHPFEVTEPAWKLFGTNPAGTPAGTGTLPLGEGIKDIEQNQLGDGSIEGEFTNSAPNTTGSIDVYRFWSNNDGPLAVRTVAIDDSVNTNIKVYRAHFDNTGNQVVQYLEQVPNTFGSFDWMPADRTTVDAQVIINDFANLQYSSPNNPYRQTPTFGERSGGMYFVVVKNQEGSLGRYRVEVNAPSFPELGGVSASGVTAYSSALQNQVAYLPLDGNPLQLKLNYTDSFNEFVGYFPIQMPQYHNGTLSVTSQSKWDFDLYDAAGNKLPGRETDGATTGATFTVAAGSQTVYLRVKEQAGTATPNASAVISLMTDTTLPMASPSASLPTTPAPRVLPVDPFGDALGGDVLHDSFSAAGQTKVYTFRAPTQNSVKFTVQPDNAGAMNVQWAVYVNGTLRAWNLTKQTGGQFDPLGSNMTLRLPGLEDPTPSDTDALEYLSGSVQLVVRSVGSPAAGQGGFTVAVDNDAKLPSALWANDITFNTIQLPDPVTEKTIFGNTFYRVFVPDHTTGVNIEATPNNTGPVAGSQQLRWELYNATGEKLSEGTANTDFITHKASFSIPEMTKGNMYFLRVGVASDASLTLDVKLKELSIKQFAQKPPATMPLLEGEVIRRTSPPPSGIFTTYYTTTLGDPNPNVKESQAFWVQNGGMAHFDAFFNPGNNVNADDLALAVYRMVGDSGEFATYSLELVDYTNRFGMVDGRYSLDVYLDPGAYVLKAIRASTGNVSSHVNWRLPAYTPEEIALDPNSGSNATITNLLNIDNAPAAVNPMESFRTHFYRVIAPGAAQGGLTATAINLTTDDFGDEDRDAFISMWEADPTQPGGYRPFTNAAGTGKIDPTTINNTTISPNTVADAGDVYYLALNRNGLSSKIGVGVTFEVPQSGIADFVVDPIQLSPDNGQTLVTITVHNKGYAPAAVSNSKFSFTDTSHLVTTTTEAILQQLPLGALGTVTLTLPWLPTRPADQVFFTADYDHKVEEFREDNNDRSVALSTVDAHRPTLSLALSDGQMDANAAADVWGRYISGVDARTDLLFNAADADGKLYMIKGFRPYEGLDHPVSSGGQFYFFNVNGSATQAKLQNYNFGRLYQTQGNNPNHLSAYVVDEYGLMSDERVQTIQVVPMPSWLDNDSSSVTFDPKTHKYTLDFQADILRYEATIDELVHAEIPFIGDKKNLVLGEVYSSGLATLNPNDPIELPLKAHAQVTVLGEDVLNETWEGTTSPTDHFSISTFIHLNSTSLEADQFEVTFRLTDLPLFNFVSPEIPLFAYGVPGVASINANLQFSLNAELDAALTLALRPDGHGGVDFGLATPTFIRPEITAGLSFSGEVEVLGFDVASLSGTVNFKLAFAYGLDTSDVFVPFLDFFNEAELNVNGELWGSIEATVIGFTVLDFDFPHLLMDFSTGGTVATLGAPVNVKVLADPPAPVVHGGDQAITEYQGHESPQLVVDPASGDGMYVQTADNDASDAGYLGGLRYARRHNGGWSALQPLSSEINITTPLLALSHDGAGSPSVVTYQAYNGVGGPVGKTRNAFLAGQDLRYRYFDGANWGAEQSVTTDGLHDGDHAVAFNNAGKGALVWVRNKNASPVTPEGQYLRGGNEIMVSMWDAATHTWGAPVPLTNDSTADSQPSVYVAQDGKVYVAWLRDTAGRNEIVYRTFNNGSWSDTATLPVSGLLAGGRFRSIALGGDAAGKITTMMWYSVTDPDVSDDNAIESDSRLYARTTTAAGFGQSAAAVEVDKDGNYSRLSVINAPDGSLLAYWARSDGQINDVYAAKLAGNGTWSQPVRLTGGSEIELNPSLAVDTDGSYDLVYEKRQPEMLPFSDQVPQPTPVYGQPLPLSPAGQVGTAVLQNKPELSFSRQMFFPVQDQAAQGSQATAEATIVNTGLVDTSVLVEFLEMPATPGGQPTVLGSQQVFLKAGSRTDLSHAFVVKPGAVTYGMRVSPVGNSEAVSGADNLSTATLKGMADIAIVSVALSKPEPKAGETINLTAQVKNLTNVATGLFVVSFYEDDPTTPNFVKRLIGQTTINLAAGETKAVTVPYTVPANGGSFILTAVADSGKVIEEATEANNTAGVVIAVRPDPKVGELTPGVQASATVLNFTGVNNVRIDGVVRNDGDAPQTNLKVRLMWSLDDGAFVAGETRTLTQVLPGQAIPVSFTASGLAGINRYQIVVDPDVETKDSDRTNNVAETNVFIQGLPDLKVTDFTLDPASPAQGVPLKLNALIQNVGIDEAKNVEIEVYARLLAGPGPSGKLPTEGILVGKIKLDELKALSSLAVSIDIDTSKLVGAVELSMEVDPKLKVLESTDLNNVVTKTFTFSAGGPRVVGRHVFYNRSKFDGNDPLPGATDDGAIATDKVALLPGQSAGFNNYTSYSRGLNGIMVDVFHLPDGTPTAADFDFRVGTSGNPSGWAAGPAPAYVTVRRGAGVNGSDRITIIWADGAIAKKWLQVTVKPTARTGLKDPDVFYFGNLPGETGNSPTAATVNAIDLAGVRANQLKSNLPVTDKFDLNRDGTVNAIDLGIARSNQLSALSLITAPGGSGTFLTGSFSGATGAFASGGPISEMLDAAGEVLAA